MMPLGFESAAEAGISSVARGTSSSRELSKPYGLAVDAAGYVYVADKNNGRICKMASDGTTVP
jgi:hypothetical protein